MRDLRIRDVGQHAVLAQQAGQEVPPPDGEHPVGPPHGGLAQAHGLELVEEQGPGARGLEHDVGQGLRHAGHQVLARQVGVVQGVGDAVHGPGGRPLELDGAGGGEEVRLPRETGIDGALRVAGLRRDAGEGGARVTLPSEHPSRVVEDGRADILAAGSGRHVALSMPMVLNTDGIESASTRQRGPMSSTPTDADHHGPGPAPDPAHLDDLPPATLVARGLTLRGSRGPVFGSLDLVLPPQTHLAVLGTQGSGRSALLLALTGRLQGVRGELVLTGGPVDVALDGPERPAARAYRPPIDAARHPHALRARTAVAHTTDVVELEPALTVAEVVDERCLADGVRRRAGRARFALLADAVRLSVAPEAVVGELSAPDRALLAAVVACLRPARLVTFDDVDATLTIDELVALHAALDVLKDHGHPFAVSAVASAPVPRDAVVLTLPPVREN